VRLYVDPWDPGYGSTLETPEDAPTAESSAHLRLDVELPPAAWRPLDPPGDARAPDVVLLVDGVRRVDARVWVEEDDASLHPGLAASYAAGVVRCDLRAGCAEVVAAQVRRGLFTASSAAPDVGTGGTRYTAVRVKAAEPAKLLAAIQPHLHDLEAEVSARARPGADDLVVLDGPWHAGAGVTRVLGYVKSHHRQYLPPELSTVVTGLRPGQRSPVFQVGPTWHQYTWYLRLPGPPGSPWSGIVRVEAAADLPAGEAIRLADESTVTLPRFASTAYTDPRAPQNLVPIAGLERKLRGMLGDARLLHRHLTREGS
jgi:hypothetical protein